MCDKMILKKPVYSMKNLLLFFGQFCAWIVFMSFIIRSNIISTKNLDQFAPISLISVQTSISLLSITIMQLILPDGKERVFGVTYQNILFKWKILKYFNALDSMLYMLLLMIINISLSVVSVVTNNDVQNICKMCFICLMLETFVLAVYMIYLGLITKFKKSRIYYLLYKKMRKRNRQSDEVYNMLLHGMQKYRFDFKDKNIDYLKDEVKILDYMIYYIDGFELYNINKKDTLKIFKKERKKRIRYINK